MVTNEERLQAIFHLYESQHGYAPSRTREVVEWAEGQNSWMRASSAQPLPR